MAWSASIAAHPTLLANPLAVFLLYLILLFCWLLAVVLAVLEQIFPFLFSVSRAALAPRLTLSPPPQVDHFVCLFLHYGRSKICRVPHALPSVENRALGKEWLCRVPQRARRLAKHATRQRHSLPSATLGKERTQQNTRQLPVYPAHAVTIFKKNVYRALNLTLGKEALCRVLRPGTRQRPSLPSVRHGTRQSIFVFF